MRNVTGVIKTLKDEPYANKIIQFQLCDRYGNPKNRMDYKDLGEVAGECARGNNFEVQIVTSGEATTTSDGAFDVWLGVTECDGLGDYYEMRFEKESGLSSIKLYVRAGDGAIDWEKLTEPYVRDKALSELLCDGSVNINARRALERYFNGEKLHNANEQRLIRNFLNYADGYNDKEEMENIDTGVMDVM